MTDDLATVEAPATVHRIARGPDVWCWPDWAYAGPDGTFGNRWDDPDGLYRVLYACSERVGAFVETLARFRPSPSVIAALGAIDGIDDAVPPGAIHRSWLAERAIGRAVLHGSFVDVGHAASLAVLNRRLAARVVHHGIRELDAAAIRLSVPRRFTQEVSRFVYEQTRPDGRPAFAGIFYRSRLGDNFGNWVVFERGDVDLVRLGQDALDAHDPDFLEALGILELTLVG